ncbi:MAG: VF530 family protein [Spirochaetes bacterium]|nr:VF530 family protein [Spirochaetota bacterium]
MSEEQPNNPLHGLTLEVILEALVERYGWESLARRIPVRCFTYEPSVKSSLAFLRRTPWAREKVEQLYIRSRIRTRRGSPPPPNTKTP